VTTATDELAELRAERATAGARVTDLEREWQAANEEAAQSSAALAEVERHGGSASTRHKAKDALAAAKAKAAEPWAERLDGARRAVRDHDVRVREHVAGNLPDLVEAHEAEGEAPAAKMNARRPTSLRLPPSGARLRRSSRRPSSSWPRLHRAT
jgi:hypothetical protein